MNKYIRCPNCGFEYLPGEIFSPKHFLGEPRNIVRNNIGEILGYDGLGMDLEESFVCSNCDLEFNVYAKVNFLTEDCAAEESKPKSVDLFFGL